MVGRAAAIETVEVGSRKAWRKWLQGHHDSVSEIWLVFHKRHTGVVTLSYDDAVEEGLCYGWIDSIIRRLDDDRYARKFTPRKTDSKWSSINRRRYADLEAHGLLAAPGRKRSPTSRSGDAPRPKEGTLNPRADQNDCGTAHSENSVELSAGTHSSSMRIRLRVPSLL